MCSELPGCPVFPESMTAKYSHIWNLLMLDNKTFKRKATCGEKKINLQTNCGVETYYSTSLEGDRTLVRDFCQSLSSSEGRADPSWQDSPCRLCSRCLQGCCTLTLSAPPGTCTAWSGCPQWNACAKEKKCLINSSRLLRRGESTTWKAGVDHSSLPSHFSCILHPISLYSLSAV